MLNICQTLPWTTNRTEATRKGILCRKEVQDVFRKFEVTVWAKCRAHAGGGRENDEGLRLNRDSGDVRNGNIWESKLEEFFRSLVLRQFICYGLFQCSHAMWVFQDLKPVINVSTEVSTRKSAIWTGLLISTQIFLWVRGNFLSLFLMSFESIAHILIVRVSGNVFLFVYNCNYLILCFSLLVVVPIMRWDKMILLFSILWLEKETPSTPPKKKCYFSKTLELLTGQIMAQAQISKCLLF